MKIAVVGDLIVDEYYDVEVNRISPEYPIPVYSMESDKPTRVFRGGAAGVAQQIAAFGHNVHLYTRCDVADAEALSAEGVETRYTVCSAPIKRRYYSSKTPLTRIDIEDTSPNGAMDEDVLLKVFADDFYDVVVFSDYHKGFFLNTQSWVAAAGRTYTIVDSKKNPEAWEGCCCFKPNSHAALDITGETDIERAALQILREYSFDSVVVTDGDRGVAYAVDGECGLIENRTKVKDAFVIGAGDSFAAGLAIGMANRFGLTNKQDTLEWRIRKSMKLSSKVVELGRIITPIDLLDKVVHFSELHHLVNRDFGLVLANGCFDLLHPGHLKLLKVAKEHGDKLLVAVNSDSSVRNLKGKNRPIVPQETRVELLAALPYVDYICVFDNETPLRVIEEVQPDTIVKGDDHDPDKVVGAGLARVVIVPRDDWSTTNIIRSVGSKFFAKLLGRR